MAGIGAQTVHPHQRSEGGPVDRANLADDVPEGGLEEQGSARVADGKADDRAIGRDVGSDPSAGRVDEGPIVMVRDVWRSHRDKVRVRAGVEDAASVRDVVIGRNEGAAAIAPLS